MVSARLMAALAYAPHPSRLASWHIALTPPTLGERCHRSLARRLEPWCASAPERQYLALLRNLLANDYAATYLDASFVDAISARR